MFLLYLYIPNVCSMSASKLFGSNVMNSSEEHILRSKDSFSEVDDINGHLKKMLSGTLLNGFRKNGVPNHELTLKVGDVCLVTRAIHGLGLANNSRIRIIAIHRYCVEVVTIGEYREQNVRIPRISFRFRFNWGVLLKFESLILRNRVTPDNWIRIRIPRIMVNLRKLLDLSLTGNFDNTTIW